MHVADSVQRSRVTLVGGFLTPSERLGIILWKALAVVIHASQIELGFRVALIGSFAVPARSLSVVLRQSPAFVVHDAEIELSFRVTLFGRFAHAG